MLNTSVESLFTWISTFLSWYFMFLSELSKSISLLHYWLMFAFVCATTLYFLLSSFEFSFLLIATQNTLGDTEFKRLYKISCSKKSYSSLTPCPVNPMAQQHHHGYRFWPSALLQFWYLWLWSQLYLIALGITSI